MGKALKLRLARLQRAFPRLPLVVIVPPETGTRRTEALARIAQAEAEGRHVIRFVRDGDPEGER